MTSRSLPGPRRPRSPFGPARGAQGFSDALDLAVAGCGSANGGSAGAPTPKTASGQAAAVGVATTRLGKTLVGSNGRTLYLFKKDLGTKSSCAGTCAGAWPPL